ncbi:MAG: ATP-binding protein [Thermomicrobiales bacterium]
MSIRTRLAIAVGLVLMVMLGVLGFATIRATDTILTDRVEKQILEAVAEFQRPGRAAEVFANWDQDKLDGYRANPVAIGFVSNGGELKWFETSGYGNDPDQPPEIPRAGSVGFSNLIRGSTELRTDDGSEMYLVRAVALSADDEPQGHLVIAAPMSGVEDTITSLTRWLIAGGAVALLITIAIVWLIIRQGLRPVEKMIDTAAAIAHGDLTQRVPESAIDPYTELGRLGGALNEMLGHIEHSSTIRDASEARLRQFIADAAHELRTPLTSLRGYAELYRQGVLRDTPAVDNAMGRIESEGTRMARLVDELLLLARLDQQRGLELSQVDLTEICRDAVGDFRVVEPGRPVSDNLVASVVVLGDRLRLRQIVDNLLTNARVHTSPTTAVTVTTRVVGNTVRMDVHDDGQGISAEDQTHIFERFWRGDPSRGRRSGSSGLGLSIVASLVESHGGSITVQSEPGSGTTFTVELPLADPAGVLPESPRRDRVGSASSGE